MAEPQILYRAEHQDIDPPAEPVKVALIGAGNRASIVYAPQIPMLEPWIDVVAVCDPVKENCDAYAERIGAQPVYDIRELVRSCPMEAAIVVTPVPSHHSISVYLSSHGIHNHIETTWASTVTQARQMIDTAAAHNVIVRVGENFLRFPIDRFAQTVRDCEYVGPVGRIFSYADHTGYHNNSRWIAFAGSAPQWVQSFSHSMAHPAFYSMAHRRHDHEELKLRMFGFDDDFVVVDIGSGHVKGHLGRHPRPGYTEWHGTRGTLINRADGHGWGQGETVELRRLSDEFLAPAQEAAGLSYGGGHADQITPVQTEITAERWARTFADTPDGRIEYVNRIRAASEGGKAHLRIWYGTALVDHVIDFALAVRSRRTSEFTEHDALASQMMEIAAVESARQGGRRIDLPLTEDMETDARELAAVREQFNVDPMDVDAMLDISYPRP